MRKIEARATNRSKKANAKRLDEIERRKELKKVQVAGVLFTLVDGVKVIAYPEWVKVNGKYEQKLFRWCQKHKAHFYSRVKADFSMEKAIEEMKSLKREVLVIKEV